MATAEQYVARGGYWWSGSHRGPAYTSAPDSFVLGTTKPDTSNTGLAVRGLSVGSLTVHNGDWTITEPGLYDGHLVRGLVNITGDNVVLRNSLVVSRDLGYNGLRGMVTISGSNVLVENCELTQWDAATSTDNSRFWINGIYMTGGSATVRRCNIHDVTDAIDVLGGEATIEGNCVHSLSYRSDDTDQGVSAVPPYGSHNDGIQCRGGTDHDFTGNNFVMDFSLNTGMPKYINSGWPSGGDNALDLDPAWPDANWGTVRWDNAHGILVQSSFNVVTGVQINQNWFSYGAIGVQFSNTSGGDNQPGGTASMSGNRITPNQSTQYSNCTQLSIQPRSVWTVTGYDTTVYSDDAFVPAAWRGHVLQDPYVDSNQITYSNPNWSLTP